MVAASLRSIFRHRMARALEGDGSSIGSARASEKRAHRFQFLLKSTKAHSLNQNLLSGALTFCDANEIPHKQPFS